VPSSTVLCMSCTINEWSRASRTRRCCVSWFDYPAGAMAPPRDVMRETRDFDAMREALRRAIAGEGDPSASKPRDFSDRRTRRKAKRRFR
jgi:hypothetical protein